MMTPSHAIITSHYMPFVLTFLLEWMTINVFGAWVFVSISFSPEILQKLYTQLSNPFISMSDYLETIEDHRNQGNLPIRQRPSRLVASHGSLDEAGRCLKNPNLDTMTQTYVCLGPWFLFQHL
jgi:hypothetical protein